MKTYYLIQNNITLTETQQKKMKTEKSETTILHRNIALSLSLLVPSCLSFPPSFSFPSFKAYFSKRDYFAWIPPEIDFMLMSPIFLEILPA